MRLVLQFKRQDNYVDDLFDAAGGVSISKSYKKQLFKGVDNGKKKNLTIERSVFVTNIKKRMFRLQP